MHIVRRGPREGGGDTKVGEEIGTSGSIREKVPVEVLRVGRGEESGPVVLQDGGGGQKRAYQDRVRDRVLVEVEGR